MNRRPFLALAFSSFLPKRTNAIEPPIEAGKVRWGRDLRDALALSDSSGKPVLVLFQEIPGCAGCRQFGQDVLSNPLLVEAIETEFTPLLIHNNKSGKDADVLRLYGEPAWNYQVVRFLDAAGKDLIPRKDRVWDTGALAERMVGALTKASRPVPGYLRLLTSEHFSGLQSAVFAMSCFWTGEMALGQINGVIVTEAGFMDGREVTAVRYDPRLISLLDLMAAAGKVNCAQAIYLPEADLERSVSSRLVIRKIADYRRAPVDDQKKQLTGTPAERLNLSAAQATKVNAWYRQNREMATSYLTPSQRLMMKGR
jgi:hypothetical protein